MNTSTTYQHAWMLCTFMYAHTYRVDESCKCCQMFVKHIWTSLLFPLLCFVLFYVSLDRLIWLLLWTELRDHKSTTTVTVSSTWCFFLTSTTGRCFTKRSLTWTVIDFATVCYSFFLFLNIACIVYLWTTGFYFLVYMCFEYCWVVLQPRYGKQCAKGEIYIDKKKNQFCCFGKYEVLFCSLINTSV